MVSNPCAGQKEQAVEAPTLTIQLLPEFSLTNAAYSSKAGGDDPTRNINVPWIPQYISGLYKYGVAIAGVMAAVMMMIGGLRYLTAGGSSGRVSKAKEQIVDSLLGLLLVLGSYLVLNTVNPDLVTFRDLEMMKIEKTLYEVSPGIAEGAPDPIDKSQPEAPSNIPKPKPTSGPVGQDNVPFFMQYDPKWNPKDLSWMPAGTKGSRTDCTSIAQRGCGTTSLAMVLNYYGAGTDPMKTAAWGLGCTGGWQPFATVSKLGKEFSGFKGDYIGSRKTDITQRMDKLISLVNSGKPVIYNCAPCKGWDVNGKPRNYGGHYIVLTGYDKASQSFRVNDPGRPHSSNIKTITYEAVANNWVVAVYVHK
jgi:hypothetical protein